MYCALWHARIRCIANRSWQAELRRVPPVNLVSSGRLLVDSQPRHGSWQSVGSSRDDPFLAAAKRLLDAAHDCGFHFDRIANGPDGPLRGVRDSPDWHDEIFLAGFSDSCSAVRRRKSSLVVPGGLPVCTRVDGDAITVLHTVLTEWPI